MHTNKSTCHCTITDNLLFFTWKMWGIKACAGVFYETTGRNTIHVTGSMENSENKE